MIASGTARLVTDPGTVSRYHRALEPRVARSMDQVIAIIRAMISGVRLARWCQ